MNQAFWNRRGTAQIFVLLCLTIPMTSWAAPSPLTAEELLAKVAERAKRQNAKSPSHEFIWTKTTLELDKKHRVNKREELTFRMVILDNVLYPRLIRKNGRPLTQSEQAQEAEKEAAFKSSKAIDSHSDERNTVLLKLDEGTAKRFDYAITGREQVNGRLAYVVTVTPRPGLPATSIEEQVMAQMSGRLWVDEAEYELVRLDVRLLNPVHFGLVSVLGALNELDFSVHRSRSPEGDWENSLVKAWLHFRVLLKTRRFQYEERVSPIPPGE